LSSPTIEIPIHNGAALDAIFKHPARFKLVRKGRRVGLTRSKAHHYIECCLDAAKAGGRKKYLWVDTVQRNIDRYYERFFWRALRHIPQSLVPWSWNGQRKTLQIADSLIDFGSAERPENLEGFGYDEMFLNEAGIILRGESGKRLWEESLRPMLADSGGGALIGGVPKGVRDNYFPELWESSIGRPDWERWILSTYDSPYVAKQEARDMEMQMHPRTARQEIYAEFVDHAETQLPWLHNYTDEHISPLAEYNESRPVILSFDFNVDPMTVTCHHAWFDKTGHHWHTFDEISIPNGSVPGAIDRIKQKFPDKILAKCIITGDATAGKRDINRIDHRSSWVLIQKGLNVSDSRFKVPRSNPSLSSNRELCNYILYAHPDVKVNPRCKTLVYELKYTEGASDGTIPKKNRAKLEQRADALDTWRYVANAFLPDFVDKVGKYKVSK